ncbi:hypothetical protein CDL15_Pgr012947 [Punica granatum]|uniref:Uncharacterized protein n=1 Tax=Punica granatum TaxID=22663 RepID=A0A218XFG9_PUNGR|nr:hypothetical protein CDL15_Pgr012947 [Punica granatum]
MKSEYRSFVLFLSGVWDSENWSLEDRPYETSLGHEAPDDGHWLLSAEGPPRDSSRTPWDVSLNRKDSSHIGFRRQQFFAPVVDSMDPEITAEIRTKSEP